MPVSDAQKKANEKWKAANREKQKIYNYKSKAKKYISDFGEEKDSQDLEKLIAERSKLIQADKNL